MVEEDIIQVAQKNCWNYVIHRKVINDHIVILLEITEQTTEQKKSNTRIIKISTDITSNTTGG